MNTPKGFEVTATHKAKCKRCGCEEVIWAQNAKGKFYLIKVRGYDPTYKVYVGNKAVYHNCEEYRKFAKENNLTFVL